MLGSLILPEDRLGEVFAINRYNAIRQKAGQSPQTEYFLRASEVAGANLNLSRVWVIIGMHTASASELLINALMPYMEVVTVGSTSEGKNVGMYEISSTQYGLSLYPVTFQSYNSLNESNYKNGFTPQYPLDELFTTRASYAAMKELGDPQELLLSYVLSFLQNSTVEGSQTTGTRSAVSSVSSGGTVPRGVGIASSIDDRPLKGMLEPMPAGF